LVISRVCSPLSSILPVRLNFRMLEPSHSQTDTHQALVIGDVTVDWNLPRLGRNGTWNDPEKHFSAEGAPGGAALLGRLLREVARGLPWHVSYADRDDGCDQLFTVWTHQEVSEKNEKSEKSDSSQKKGEVWRVAELLGTRRGTRDRLPVLNAHDETTPIRLLVIDDKARGFRDRPELWEPLLGRLAADAWIIWRVGRPLGPVSAGESAPGDNPLWQTLLVRYPARLIAVMTASDVRESEVHVSRELSWESTALDLHRELKGSSSVAAVARSAYSVICFDTAGALLMPAEPPHGTPALPCQLTLDPRTMEGDQRRLDRGYVAGNTYCVIAALVRSLMESLATEEHPAPNQVSAAVEVGLHAARELHNHGYNYVRGAGLQFPALTIADQFTASGRREQNAWVRVDLPSLAGSGPQFADSWTILSATCGENFDGTARDVALRGVDAVQNRVPVLRFGDYAVLDRREVEGCRSIQRLIVDYARSSRGKPLSVAVFGPPGSGKSFGITQMAKTVFPRDSVEVLTFNLSQFTDAEDLRGALHQVRDVTLRGKLPLVFWDEFDCTVRGDELGWLPFFLAPMQDGTFQDGQITHPTGKSVFVFAGGTSTHYAEFETRAHARRAQKGPDFASRLLGYMDVVGINPHPSPDEDRAYVLRRAVLLHSLLCKHCPSLKKSNGFDLDRGLLNAFLHVPEYKHGARSMEAIVAMSTLVDRPRFERSSVPSEAQLNLHVDGREFRHLMR
jgi:hypothetical protein